ncbi:hypothetical protein M2150_001686 [Lachnospiraceae bacterium PM6-15]|uniref:LPD11 domain-containing protein n=1 Tax=Ohessyouella blattaphilus TaxID=2949333 RepID=UPI003E18FB24
MGIQVFNWNIIGHEANVKEVCRQISADATDEPRFGFMLPLTRFMKDPAISERMIKSDGMASVSVQGEVAWGISATQLKELHEGRDCTYTSLMDVCSKNNVFIVACSEKEFEYSEEFIVNNKGEVGKDEHLTYASVYDLSMMKERYFSELVLGYVGEDRLNHPTYKDQNNCLWKDLGMGSNETPTLYSVIGNVIDGDPYKPLPESVPFRIREGKPLLAETKYAYQLLGRLQADCEYYLGFGNRSKNRLWGKNPEEHIAKMKEIWNGFKDNEKPEWLTMELIKIYEKEMIPDVRKPKKKDKAR